LDVLFDEGRLRRSDLDNGTLSALEDLDDDLADIVVGRFSRVNFSKVDNINGYLMGILRRVEKDGSGAYERNLNELCYAVRHRVLDLIDSGILHRSDVDRRLIRGLQSLPRDLALESLRKLTLANLENVRNKSGFMIGIIKRLQETSAYHYWRRHDRH